MIRSGNRHPFRATNFHHGLSDHQFIVDDQDVPRHAHDPTGIRIIKIVPAPTSLSTEIVPLWLSTIPQVTANPVPGGIDLFPAMPAATVPQTALHESFQGNFERVDRGTAIRTQLTLGYQ